MAAQVGPGRAGTFRRWQSLQSFAGVNPPAPDELGAHVSTEGGVVRAPARAAALDAAVLQLFTKQPSRWAEPKLEAGTIQAFREQRATHGIVVAVSHDSYLINLSSPDRRLWRMSQRCFAGELARAAALGLEFVVTHPGNATDGDLPAGIQRNGEGIAESLEALGEAPTMVLLELTAGSGTSVGGSFENLRAILDAIPEGQRGRVGVCFDTCHGYSAGYDLVTDYDGVWSAFDETIGLDRLRLIHMNDSKHPLGSRKDRHETIGEGTLGPEPFRRIMRDERLRRVPKVLETPKGDDEVSADRANLALLRSFRDG
jgi:deoxyribonuclease-4